MERPQIEDDAEDACAKGVQGPRLIPIGGHFPQREHPSLIQALVGRFLAS